MHVLGPILGYIRKKMYFIFDIKFNLNTWNLSFVPNSVETYGVGILTLVSILLMQINFGIFEIENTATPCTTEIHL